MAHFGKDSDDLKASRCVHIRSIEQTEHFTVYIITVTIGSYTWTVRHRYSEFYDLHEKLTASYKVDKTLLPPKKIFGNQTESFIKKRQQELQVYLQTIIVLLAKRIPPCLAYFLDFDKYEIHGITQAMAEDLYSRGEMMLQSREKYEVSTLQLYTLTERLKLPEPTCDSGDVKKDLGHILDYVTRTKHLKVTCSRAPVESSNIMMSKLPFDLTLFKSLQSLEICGCNFQLINGLDTVKQTIIKLEVHESTSSMKEMFLQDAIHWKAEDGSAMVDSWNLVTEVDLSRNSFSDIHESIQLMPNVEKLNLSLNMIESIQNLQWLSQLTHLDLSHNNIHHVDSLHIKMGNIKCLRIAYNQLESLHGFAKLFSLQTLDVSYNKITSIEELRFVSQLPCVEELSLEGNTVISSLDYRTKTLLMFGDRVGEVILDGIPPSQKELDTVAVLQALRKAKDVKIAKKILPKKNASFVSLSDVYSQSPSGSLSEHPDGMNSQNTSPAHGVSSGSMPSSLADWHRKDSTGNNRSSSSFSQDSFSYSSVHEGDDETFIASEAYPYNGILPPMAGVTSAATKMRGSQKLSSNCDGHDNFENIGSGYENKNTYLPEQVPEAHPYDLTIENPASFSPSSDVTLTSPRRYVNTGQLSQLYQLAKSPSSFPATTNTSATPLQIPAFVSPDYKVTLTNSHSCINTGHVTQVRRFSESESSSLAKISISSTPQEIPVYTNPVSVSPSSEVTLTNSQSMNTGQATQLPHLSGSESSSPILINMNSTPPQISEYATSSLPVSVVSPESTTFTSDESKLPDTPSSQTQELEHAHETFVKEKDVSTEHCS